MNKIILVEGIEGCGKSTLIANLTNKFVKNGAHVDCIYGSPVEDMFRKEIRELFAKSDGLTPDEEHALGFMLAIDKFVTLSKGGTIYNSKMDTIIVDRFIDSFEVYNKNFFTKVQWDIIYPKIQRMLIDLGRMVYHVYIKINPEIATERISRRKGKKKEWADSIESQKMHAERYDQIFPLEISKNILMHGIGSSLLNTDKEYAGASLFQENDYLVRPEPLLKEVQIIVNGELTKEAMTTIVYNKICSVDEIVSNI